MKKYLLLFILLLPFTSSAFSKDLFYGIQDSEVSELQEFLTSEGFYTGPITGNFYSLTLKAVKDYQAANLLPSTGYFGPLTRENVQNKQAKITDESGSDVTPVQTQNATTNDVVSKLNDQISLLLQQIQELQKQQAELVAIKNKQAEQEAILGQIQANTAPKEEAVFVAPKAPEVVKELNVSSNYSKIEVGGYTRQVTIKALYTEDGKIVVTDTSFTAPDGSITLLKKEKGLCKINDELDCRGDAVFFYQPKTVGNQTITVTAGGLTRTINLEAIPYVKADPIVRKENVSVTSPILSGDERRTIGGISFTKSDEDIRIDEIKITSSILNAEFLLETSRLPTVSTEIVEKGNGRIYTIKLLKAPAPGTYTATIEKIKVIGMTSSQTREVQGLPITITFEVK